MAAGREGTGKSSFGIRLAAQIARGLLPGVLRAELIANGSAVEADLTPADLKDGFFVGNASRGLLPAQLNALSHIDF